MNLLHKRADGGVLVDTHHSAEGAEGMQRSLRQEGNAPAAFAQLVVDRNEGNEPKKENLQPVPQPFSLLAFLRFHVFSLNSRISISYSQVVKKL